MLDKLQPAVVLPQTSVVWWRGCVIPAPKQQPISTVRLVGNSIFLDKYYGVLVHGEGLALGRLWAGLRQAFDRLSTGFRQGTGTPE
jgi:hypothetical protein